MAVPNSNFLSLFGDALYSPSTNKTVAPSDALQGKIVLMYFSAHWCVLGIFSVLCLVCLWRFSTVVVKWLVVLVSVAMELNLTC